MYFRNNSGTDLIQISKNSVFGHINVSTSAMSDGKSNSKRGVSSISKNGGTVQLVYGNSSSSETAGYLYSYGLGQDKTSVYHVYCPVCGTVWFSVKKTTATGISDLSCKHTGSQPDPNKCQKSLTGKDTSYDF